MKLTGPNLSRMALWSRKPKPGTMVGRQSEAAVPRDSFQSSSKSETGAFPSLKEGARKLGYVATVGAVAAFGAAAGAIPVAGFLSNAFLGARAMENLKPRSSKATLDGGTIGMVSNLGGSLAAIATESLAGLAIGGVVGGASGLIVGKELADDIFGSWKKP